MICPTEGTLIKMRHPHAKSSSANPNRKRGSNETCDDAGGLAGELKAVKIGVVTGPSADAFLPRP
jgi:hypothetical protein